MNISFDVWGTLMKSSPVFRQKKRDLVRQFLKKDLKDEVIDNAFKQIKQINNETIEVFGNQPDTYTLFCQVISLLCSDKKYHDIDTFVEKYSKLFVDYPPSIIGGEETVDLLLSLRNSWKNSSPTHLFISSNTLFINGNTWEKVFKNLGIHHYFEHMNFSSDVGKSKPDKSMFEYPGRMAQLQTYHIGDNTITDGSCEKYGIQFYQINSNNKTLKDFYDEKIVFSS